MIILWAVLILAGLGLLFGLGLAVASKVFYVKEDTRVEDITAILPNANCGACGYPGCAGYAEFCPGNGPARRLFRRKRLSAKHILGLLHEDDGAGSRQRRCRERCFNS